MAAIYNVFRNPNPEKAGRPKNDRLHPRLVNQKTIRIDQMIDEISEFASFSSADVKGMLASFQHQLVLHLSRGEIVELEGLGTFNVSLKSTQATTEKEITPSTIAFGKVVFRCSKELKDKLKQMKFRRSDEGSRLRGYPEAKRKDNILAYLASKPTISSTICCGLNGCSKYMAIKDLSELQQAGKIARLGSQHNLLYTAVKENI
ncbi:MAG: HU family DNA-binding protein [Prevotellaceae bacterium]|jgi:predicted histone-like DNA-binding protein|nr:HU family DNA-binding protein [Prevotellaceae bacterium]